ncbi:unnamed protein product [Somion occarium]|uniref:Uncharacterized protein n=1 Tax=Somion occarium TaxID=3059160 RepID=A0ABP1EA34_9APHY
MSLRAPTPSRRISVAPPKPAVDAKPQYQVEELLVRIRGLERAVEKHKAAVVSEQARSKDAVQKIQQTWAKEREDWQAGCDAIQVAHRINFLKTTLDLEKQKGIVLQEKENSRKEQLARLQRDFNLVKFQIEESEQEDRMARMEDELEEMEEELERVSQEHKQELEHAKQSFQGELDAFRTRCDRLETKLGEKLEELENALEEKAQLEKTLAGLRAEHTALLSSSTSKGSDLERANLRYESLKSTHTELETKFADAQQANADLRRQLDKWRDLENREGDELAELRKVNLELKVRVEELEKKVEDANRKSKERKEKVKVVFQEQEKALEEANGLNEQLQEEIEDAKRQLAEAEKKIQDLQVQVQAEKSRADTALEIAKRPSGSGARSSPQEPTPRLASEEEVEEVVASSPPLRPRAKHAAAAASKGRKPKPQNIAQDVGDDSDVVEIVQEPAVVQRPRGRGKKVKSPTGDGSDDEVQIQDGPLKTKRSKGKNKTLEPTSEDEELARGKTAKTRGRKSPVKKNAVADDINDEDEEIQEVPAPAKRKGKRKVGTEGDSDQEVDADDRGKPSNGKAAAKAKAGGGKPASKAKVASRRASSSRKSDEKEVEEDDPDPEAEVAPKKKKRKINLFPSAQATTFNWGELSQGAGGLNIPTNLSPVKDNDAVPPRSTSRLGSAYGWNQGSRR